MEAPLELPNAILDDCVRYLKRIDDVGDGNANLR